MSHFELGSIKKLIVVSDMHLSSENSDDFLRKLSNILANETSAMVIFLGDVFDFIFIGSKFFQEKWCMFFKIIEQHNQHKFVFVEGNHDFGFHHYMPKNLKELFVFSGDSEITLEHEKIGKIKLVHGDNVVCPKNYLIFRYFVKNSFVQKILSLIPGKYLDLFFSKYASISRKKDVYRTIEANFLTQCVKGYISNNKQKPQMIILGHVHIYLDDFIDNVRCIIGSDWLSFPNYLKIDENGCVTRIYLNNIAPNFKLLQST